MLQQVGMDVRSQEGYALLFIAETSVVKTDHGIPTEMSAA